MRLIISVPIFAALATALWPVPVTYEHGDCILFIREDVVFNWYEAGARNVGSIVDQQADQFLFSDSDPTHDVQDSITLRKRYTTPSFNDVGCNSSHTVVSGEDIIDHAIKITWKTIFKQSFYPWKFHPRAWSSPSSSDAPSISVINIHVPSSSNFSTPFADNIDETYTLTLTTSGIATITANTSVGISHGLTTFTQLFYSNSDITQVYTPLAPVHITDSPKFPHRGINLDLARAFIPLSSIKTQIDALAYNKMNRLHLHITDSQSWPLVVPSLPELAAKGAYRPDLIYTVQDFDDIQRYAALRGVQVITEIDMPGHTASIAYAYPELISAFNIQPNWDTYAAEPPSGTLKLNSSAVSAFLDQLFDDVLPRVAGYSSYFHTGGDEVNRMAYELDDLVKSSDPAVLQPLMQRFVLENHDRVRKKGLTPVVWEEMLLEWNITLGKDVVVQSWQSDEAVKQIVEKGYKVLAGNYNYWYLDCGKGQWLDIDPSISQSSYPYLDYCGPFHNWRLMYSYDPYSGVPEDLQHLVIGGEAHMWAEQTDPLNLDRMIWPRGCAVAEVLWSGAKDVQGRNRSQIDASPRLSDMRERLVARGVGAEPIQMPYCTMNGTQCQLGYMRYMRQ